MATITRTIGSGGDYSTIQDWADDLDNGAIYSASDDAVGEVEAGTYVEDVSITKGNVIGLNTITLQADSSSHHDGTAGSGVVVKTSITIDTAVPCAVKWIEIHGDWGTPGSFGALMNLTNATTNNTFTGFYNCIAHAAYRVGGSIYGGYAINGGNFYNCVVYDLTLDTGSGTLCGLLLRGGTAYANKALNCTVHDLYQTRVSGTGDVYGIQAVNDTSSNPEVIRNNLVTDVVNDGSGSTACIQGTTSFNTINYNATSDAPPFAVGSIGGVVAVDQYVSITGGSEDLHLKAGSDCIGAGADLGTTPSGVQFDIDGRDRDVEGDTWDIGADQSVSAVSYTDSGSGGVTLGGSALVTFVEAEPTPFEVNLYSFVSSNLSVPLRPSLPVELPAVVYRLGSGEYPDHLDGAGDWAESIYEFAIVATKYEECISISDELRTLLQSYSGSMGTSEVWVILLDNEADRLYKPTDGSDMPTFGIEQEYRVLLRQN